MRAASRCTEIVQQTYHQQFFEAPSHNTVGNLLKRIGLYEIMRAKEIANDWIWFIDHTIQAGVTKCLLVLGIRASDFRALGRPLQCQDMSVLELLPVSKSTIPIVADQLKTLAGRLGAPMAIVSDEGSDLIGGVKQLQKAYPATVHCHDIVHKMSRLIERILKNDTDWSRYRTLCCQTGNALRQTTLGHLPPPKPKTKARHMNLGPEIDWGVGMLSLLDRNGQGSTLSKSEMALLESKVSWLREFRSSLDSWSELMQISSSVCTIVRREGYHRGIVESVVDGLGNARTEAGATLIRRGVAFLTEMQSRSVLSGKLPGSSEVIESVFGRGKRLEGQQSRSGFTTQLLAVAACVVNPTKEFIIDALRTCRIKHISQWRDEFLGQSLQSRRRRDLQKLPKTETCADAA